MKNMTVVLVVTLVIVALLAGTKPFAFAENSPINCPLFEWRADDSVVIGAQSLFFSWNGVDWEKLSYHEHGDWAWICQPFMPEFSESPIDPPPTKSPAAVRSAEYIQATSTPIAQSSAVDPWAAQRQKRLWPVADPRYDGCVMMHMGSYVCP